MHLHFVLKTNFILLILDEKKWKSESCTSEESMSKGLTLTLFFQAEHIISTHIPASHTLSPSLPLITVYSAHAQSSIPLITIYRAHTQQSIPLITIYSAHAQLSIPLNTIYSADPQLSRPLTKNNSPCGV